MVTLTISSAIQILMRPFSAEFSWCGSRAESYDAKLGLRKPMDSHLAGEACTSQALSHTILTHLILSLRQKKKGESSGGGGTGSPGYYVDVLKGPVVTIRDLEVLIHKKKKEERNHILY